MVGTVGVLRLSASIHQHPLARSRHPGESPRHTLWRSFALTNTAAGLLVSGSMQNQRALPIDAVDEGPPRSRITETG
jgi:hypothetical protein